MSNKLVILLLAVMLCLNIVGGYMLFSQNKRINNLSGQLVSSSFSQKSGLDAKEISAEEFQKIKQDVNELQFRSIVEGERQIIGSISNISADSITIKSLVKQFDELKGIDLNQPYALNSKEVEYKISIDGQTAFEGRDKSALQIGDQIKAESDQSIYGKETFIAKKITYFEPLKLSNEKGQVPTAVEKK